MRNTLVMLSVTWLQTNRQVVVDILSKVTNQSVYHELVYQNWVFKTMLTGSLDFSFFSATPHLLLDRPH